MKTKREKAVHFAAMRYAQIFGLAPIQKDLLDALLYRVYMAGQLDGIDKALIKLNETKHKK